MLVRFGTPLHTQTRTKPTCPLPQNPYFLPKTLKNMVSSTTTTTTQVISKRPTCPSCSKPIRLCLCSRIQNPGLHNSVSVTILQHCLEKNHPLNSARIARLGLKNLNVFTVFDVHCHARFAIRLLDPSGSNSSSFGQVVDSRDTQRVVSENSDEVRSGKENVGELGFRVFASLSEGKNFSSSVDSNEQCIFGNDVGDMSNAQNQVGVNAVKDCSFSISDELVVQQEHKFTCEESTDSKGVFTLQTSHRHLDTRCDVDEVSADTQLDLVSDGHKVSDVEFDSLEGMESDNGGPVISATIGKNGVISSLSHTWMLQTQCKNSKFDTILDIADARKALAEGFVVQKLQKQPLKGGAQLDECVEFEAEVPPGSVLLFPSDAAVGVSDLEQMDIKVKNLIVLDGTWSKAKRMYVENPWLKLLPHLRLDLDKMSLYNEVRAQPKPGFLSTIESIVYALKAVGESPEGLDNLLDVFESMVGDQRRCKEERLSSVSLLG